MPPPPKNNDAFILRLWQEGLSVERIAKKLAAGQGQGDMHLPKITALLEKHSIPWQYRSLPKPSTDMWDQRHAIKKRLGITTRGITLEQAKRIQRKLPRYDEQEAEGEIRRLEGDQE